MPPWKKTACGIGAPSYWREYHNLDAHCGLNVPVLVAKPSRPEEIGQVCLTLPSSITVRRWVPRSAFRTSVTGRGGAATGGGNNDNGPREIGVLLASEGTWLATALPGDSISAFAVATRVRE